MCTNIYYALSQDSWSSRVLLCSNMSSRIKQQSQEQSHFLQLRNISRGLIINTITHLFYNLESVRSHDLRYYPLSKYFLIVFNKGSLEKRKAIFMNNCNKICRLDIWSLLVPFAFSVDPLYFCWSHDGLFLLHHCTIQWW